MPQDIYGAAATSNGVFSYALGGYSTSTGTTLDTFYRYNPVNERWETRPAMPDAVAMASAVYYPTSDRIYVFGGFDPNTGTFSNATRVFDLATGTWGQRRTCRARAPSWRPATTLRTARSISSAGPTLSTVERAGDDVGVRPCGEHVHYARAIPHAVRGTAFGVIGVTSIWPAAAIRSATWSTWSGTTASPRTRGRRRPPCRARRTLPAAPPRAASSGASAARALRARSRRPRPTTR
jgi:hypothetical protein